MNEARGSPLVTEAPVKQPSLLAGMPATETKSTELRLPSLPPASNSSIVFSWQPKPATAVWTQAEWTLLGEHLHNGNPEHHFIMGFREADGCKRYVRSKKTTVKKALSWAWSSIAKSPQKRLAFVPYAQNQQGQSRWGGLDFDAHHGEADRARELAWAAFRLLLNMRDLAVILETSGSGGWHVWAISPVFHDVGDWVRLFRQVAAAIGTTVMSGVCEIFPHAATGSRYGKGMRAPGSWNPSTDQCNQIVWENTRTSLDLVHSGKSKNVAMNYNELQSHFPDRERNFLSLSPYRGVDLLKKFGITMSATRNQKLAELVGEVFHQIGHATARSLAAAQFNQKTVTTQATESEHLDSFETLWRGLTLDWTASLTATERKIYEQLRSENERDAFRIIRSYARKAKEDAAADFPIARDNLAERLEVSGKGAAWIRDKLATLGAIAKTAKYVPNKAATRYCWIADVEAENPF
jgi:hypothetical protein